MSDSNYATDPTTRRSIGGCSTFLCKACVITHSKQSSTKLSRLEAELEAGKTTAKDMLFTMRILESMKLKVKRSL